MATSEEVFGDVHDPLRGAVTPMEPAAAAAAGAGLSASRASAGGPLDDTTDLSGPPSDPFAFNVEYSFRRMPSAAKLAVKGEAEATRAGGGAAAAAAKAGEADSSDSRKRHTFYHILITNNVGFKKMVYRRWSHVRTFDEVSKQASKHA